MSTLSAKEQRQVRTTLMFLRRSIGTWKPLAKALHVESESLGKVVSGRRGVTADLALRVSRFLDIPVSDLLAGKFLPARTCPWCGHPPVDFEDEETIAEGSPTENGLKLVK